MKVNAMIRSFIKQVVDWFTESPSKPSQPVVPKEPVVSSLPVIDPQLQARSYLEKVRSKTSRLAEDFNAGIINRDQFQHLFTHYQQEIRNVEGLMEFSPTTQQWREVITEGESMLIRRKHLARAEGYAIFLTDSGMPLSTLGRFELDPALFVPMLSAYRSATKEIFGSGIRSTAIEGGRWLCFVPGVYTTMLAVFTAEPAGKQLQLLEELHRLFERANRRQLSAGQSDPNKLIFPHEYFLGQWRR
jgi:hypothetical protein